MEDAVAAQGAAHGPVPARRGSQDHESLLLRYEASDGFRLVGREGEARQGAKTEGGISSIACRGCAVWATDEARISRRKDRISQDRQLFRCRGPPGQALSLPDQNGGRGDQDDLVADQEG